MEFKLKDLRPTLTSITVNGMSLLPAMSAQMRREDLAQTQRSHGMQQGVAGKQLRDAWRDSIMVHAQKPVIDKKWD